MKKLSALPVIKGLNSQLHHLQGLSKILKSCLQEEWEPYCEIVRMDPLQKKLILSTSEQNLLLPLRFMQDKLLTQLKKKSPAFKSISVLECIYTPIFPLHPQKIKSRPNFSKESSKTCEDTALQCSASLKKALMKLSKTLKESM